MTNYWWLLKNIELKHRAINGVLKNEQEIINAKVINNFVFDQVLNRMGHLALEIKAP